MTYEESKKLKMDYIRATRANGFHANGKVTGTPSQNEINLRWDTSLYSKNLSHDEKTELFDKDIEVFEKVLSEICTFTKERFDATLVKYQVEMK